MGVAEGQQLSISAARLGDGAALTATQQTHVVHPALRLDSL